MWLGTCHNIQTHMYMQGGPTQGWVGAYRPAIRPVRLLRVWVSEVLTPADS